MALPASGAISLLDIQSTMGGGATNIAIGNYYRGGANVPDITENNNIPTSGQISFSNFYSTYGRVASNHTLGVGYIPGDKFTTETAGYNSALSLGTLNPATYSSIYGTLTVSRCQWVGSGINSVQFSLDNTNNTHFVFYEIVINGTTFTRASSSFSTASGFGLWVWGTGTNPFGTSGNITLTIRRYG